MKHDHMQISVVQDGPNRMQPPSILIARPDQSYVGAARFEDELRQYGGRQNPDGLKLLFCLPSRDGYVQAREMAELDAIKGTAHLKRTLEGAGLPAVYAESPRHTVPVVMSQVANDLFVPGVPSNVAVENIFIERTSRNKSSGTGSLVNLRVQQRYCPHERLTEEQIRVLGSWSECSDLQREGVFQGLNASLPKQFSR